MPQRDGAQPGDRVTGIRKAEASTSPPWSIVETKCSSEELAERGLRSTGYRVYLPRYRKLLLPHGRTRQSATAMRPLFARLLFVQDWRGWPTQIVAGVVGLMRITAKGPPAKLIDDDIAKMIAKERAGAFDEVRYPLGHGITAYVRDDLEVGDKVEFEMFGERIMGELEELSADGKAVVRAMLLGRETPIRGVDAESLQLVAS